MTPLADNGLKSPPLADVQSILTVAFRALSFISSHEGVGLVSVTGWFGISGGTTTTDVSIGFCVGMTAVVFGGGDCLLVDAVFAGITCACVDVLTTVVFDAVVVLETGSWSICVEIGTSQSPTETISPINIFLSDMRIESMSLLYRDISIAAAVGFCYHVVHLSMYTSRD